MKKFLPILILILAFTGFLAVQVSLDQVQTSANQSTTVKDKNARFEHLFQTVKLTSTDKKMIVLKDIKKPIVILNFWASWCTPCLKELPSLLKLSSDFPDQIETITVNADEEDQKKMIQKIKDKFKINVPIIADEGGKLADQFLISSIPFTVIFINGLVYKAHQGYFDFSDPELTKHIQSVAKK